MASFKDPIYFIKTTKDVSKSDVHAVLSAILGTDSIDKLLSIDSLEGNKRVFIVSFWRVPLVNQFHNSFDEPVNSIHGKELPWFLEIMDSYLIFRDGHYPAPHFLRNSKNLTDEELNELGIGGPGEFIYISLPKNENCDCHWEMSRDGKYYMPDLSYYNKPRLEPLGASDTPCLSRSVFSRCITKEPSMSDFKRWRDFYIEQPSSWPTDLTAEERSHLEEENAKLYTEKSTWVPECGRDPTNMVDAELQRLVSQHDVITTEPTTFPQRTLTSHKYRSFS